MFGFLIAIEVIVSILLILVILMQSSKGGGLAGTFGGGGSVGMVFGVRRTADFLTRGTQILAVIFGVLSLVINIWFLPRTTSADTVIQKGKNSGVVSPQLPPAEAPPTDNTTPAQ